MNYKNQGVLDTDTIDHLQLHLGPAFTILNSEHADKFVDVLATWEFQSLVAVLNPSRCLRVGFKVAVCMHMHHTEVKAINPRVCPEFDDLFKRGISKARAIYHEMITVFKLLYQLTEQGIACTGGDVSVQPSYSHRRNIEGPQLYNTRLVNHGPCNPLQMCMGRRRMPFVMIDNYALLSCINEGSVGRVHLAVRLTDSRICAVKVIYSGHLKRHGSLYKRLKDELTVATNLRHDNLVETCGVVATRRTILIVMEYCDGGDLISIVKRFGSLPEEFAKGVFQMILDGVACMHANGYCHRDLKPENILIKSVVGKGVCLGEYVGAVLPGLMPLGFRGGALDSLQGCMQSCVGPRAEDPQRNQRLRSCTPVKGVSLFGNTAKLKTPGNRACNPTSSLGFSRARSTPTGVPTSIGFIVKIGDFGAATRDDNMLVDTVGTMSYAAPEVLNCRGVIGYSGRAADVWSCGVVLYAMLFGQLPWNTQEATILDGYREVVTQPLEFPRAVSRQATELLKGMLSIDVGKRLELRDVMDHPWLCSGAGVVDTDCCASGAACNHLVVGDLLGT